MKKAKINELLTLLSDTDVQESLKELIPGKLFLLDKIVTDIKRYLNPSKRSLEEMRDELNNKFEASELLKDELRDTGVYLSYERRFHFHLDSTPTMSINVDKNLDIFLDPKAFNFSHEDLWKVLRLIKGVNVNNIDLDIG